MGDRNILLLGRRGAVVEEVRRELAIPGVELFGGTGIEDLRSAFAGAEIDHVIIGAGIDLEARLELVAEVFRLSDTTTVHMKDRATGLEGFLPFVRALLSGLGGYPTARADGSPAHRLGALIGRWRTRGSTVEGPTGPAAEIDAVDTYEWLPGGHAVLHRVDARVGGETVEGAEIIGYDPALEAYRTQYFGSDGPMTYTATLTEEDRRLVWSMRSERTRFTGTFGDHGDTIVGHWELLVDDGAWRPWMDITLEKGA